MIVLNKLVYSLVCLFFPCLLLINFLKTFWRTIVWFWHQMIFLVIISLIFIFFSGIFHGFLKNWIIHQLQKIFFEVIYCSCEFISIYCLKQAFWLSSIILCRFCNTNLFFIGCFKFRTCTTYFFLSLKLDTSFSIFLVTMVNHCEFHIIFSNSEHKLPEKTLYCYILCGFFWYYH